MAGTERSEGAGREYDVGLEMEGSAINGGEVGAYLCRLLKSLSEARACSVRGSGCSEWQLGAKTDAR